MEGKVFGCVYGCGLDGEWKLKLRKEKFSIEGERKKFMKRELITDNLWLLPFASVFIPIRVLI